MESFILSLPYGSAFAGLIIFVLGLAAAYYFLDNDRRARRVEENNAEDRLIKLLKTTVEEFEGKFSAQDKKIAELTRKVDELEKENETLINVLQGKDKQTQDFYKKAFATMDTSAETHKLVVELAKGMSNTNENIKKLIDLISKHANVLDHSITSNKQK